ncbi:hypothetical protein ANO11243_004360 [Dothideomycetidae sp. 11243]|nr:hypothetical protein ANO11243_004360 [fungal sp. No.11243]
MTDPAAVYANVDHTSSITRSGQASSLPPPVILYLPPGPLLSYPRPFPVASILAANVASTVVQIDYRLGLGHKYPAPVHDVLFGYDWVLRNLVGTHPLHGSARIGVFGELVGGGLATMLALTECHSRGHRIAAAAANDPILDWIFPEAVANEISQIPSSSSRAKKNDKSAFWLEMQRDPALMEMIKARPSLFRKPADWFDPFASPTLFFRSAGISVPTDHAIDEFDEISRLNQQDFLREQRQLSAITLADSSNTTDDEEAQKKPRKASTRFPNVGSGLTLPSLQLMTADHGMFHEQAAEMIHLTHRSMVRTDELRHADPDIAVMHAQERATHVIREPDSKYWHEGWDRGIADVAQWFREVL